MAFTINDNPDKYDLWIYDGTGLNPISPNPNNIFIKNGVKNIFCMPAIERATSNIPNGTGWLTSEPGTKTCNGTTYTSSGVMGQPFLTAISPHYAVGVWHYFNHGSGKPFPIKFWYRHANSGSGGFITRFVSNMLSFNDRDAWRFCRYKNGSNFNHNNSDLLLYKFSEPLPDDADFAILPIFNDKKLWRKNISTNSVPGVHLDQDSRLIPGKVYLSSSVSNDTDYCQTDDINSIIDPSIGCKIGINLTQISATFISDIFTITDNYERSNYLNFLQESGNYYDKIFRSINVLVGDSSRPFFEICLHSNSLILYSCATGGTGFDPLYPISDNNYLCGYGGVTGYLISTSMFGLNYNENESKSQALILGRDLMGGTTEEQNEAIKMIPVKAMDERYNHQFTLISDTINMDHASMYDNDLKYSHGFDFCFYVDKNSFNPSSLADSPFYPNGSFITAGDRNTLSIFGTYNYLKLKYSQNDNNPRYADGLWNEDSLKNIIFLGIEDINYGGNYGSFTLFSDFRAPLSANTFESFNVIRNAQSYKTARIKIIDYLTLHYSFFANIGKGRQLCWLDLIGSVNYKPPYIGSEINDGYWDSVTEEQKSRIFDAWDIVYSGIIELCPVISFSVLDSVNTSYSGASTWRELSDLRIKIAVEYIKRYCYLRNIECPKIIPACDSTAGFNNYNSCGESDSSSQRLRPLSNEQFLNNQIIPVLSSGVDGLLLRSTDLYDLVHAGYPGVATVAVDVSAQKKFAFNYVCNDSRTIKLYDCDYYDSIEAYTICEGAYYIFPTEPPSHEVPDYAGVRINAFDTAQQYLHDKLKLISSACVEYKTHKHNSNGMKNDLILNNGFIPWGSNLLEYSRGFNSLEYIHKLFNNKNIYINNSIGISAQHYLYDPIYTSGTDWDPNSLDTSVYDTDSSYSTGDIVRYFNESIYKWVVFKCISDVSSGEYPGRTNYFTGTGNNKEYLLSNIDYKWETKDIAVLYDNSLNIKSPNAILSNNSDLISYHNNSKYFIFAHTTPWLIPEDTMCESFAYLMHDQGNLITKNGYDNYNDIGHFAITSGGNNYGFANEYIEGVTSINDTMISKFIGLENNSSTLDSNKGIISDFIYWYRNIAYGDSKKTDTSNQLSSIIVSNNFYSDSESSTINNLAMSGSITRYQLLEYSQSIISSIKRNTLFRNSYVCNFGSFGSISGSVRMDQMPSIDYDRSEAKILDSLKQITENYSHPNTFSINLFENIDPYSDLSYIVDTRYPQSWKNRTSGIIDNNFKDSHGVEIFSDTVLNERLHEIGWRLNSDKSGIIRFTVHNKSSTYLLLHSNIDNSIFFNDLNIGYISLEIQELIEEDGSEFWLCKLFISFINEDELASFIESGLSKIYINNLIGELSVLEGMGMACSWKISKSGIEYLENNLVNSFNPSILFSILENNSFESFYIGEDINIPISIWHNDADVIHYNQSYKYSAKSLSRLLSLSDNGSYFITYEINGKSAKQFGANCNEIIIGGVNIINNGLDSFNYEKLRKYIIVYNIQDNDTMSIDASCGFVPLWVSKYGLEEPIFRCNKRYQHKNNDHVSFQSFDYNGFFDHDKYGASLENSQSSYESYNDFVSSFLRISRILRPNIKIISSLSVLNKHDNNLLSCFYHPKELCYYIARPWLMSNYAADSLHIQDDIKALLDGCFLLSYPSVPDASSGFRLGLELGLFDGNILDTESAWVFENSSEFNWDDVDRGGMLWSNYGELSMTELGYTSLNGNDSSFNKPKIVIFIKQVLDLYIRDVCSEMKALINDPISYQIPSNSEVGYGKVSFIQGIVLTSTNELKIEIVGAADYLEEDWKSYKVEWYKGKTYIDDTYGFILCNEQSGSGFINFIYGSQALAKTFINGDIVKIKLFINNGNGINYGFSNFSEIYFEVSVQNSQVYFVPSTNLNTRSTNVIQIIDPVTLGASTEIITNDLPPPFSALNYEIWAASWNVPSSFAKSIVPFIKIEGTESYPFFGGPSTPSPSDDIVSDQSYNKFKELIDKVPNGRRVLLPMFWSQNPVSKNYSPLSKIQYYINLDGTSLNGVDMLWSLWQDNCIIDAKVSFNNFISRCKDDEISFDYISDYSVFSQGDTSSIPNLRIKPGSASGTGNRHYTGYEWSVDTALESIVKDSRFSSYTNSITGTTAENDFMERYERSVQQFFDTDRSIYPTYPEEWYANPKQTALEALTPIFGYSANLVGDSSNLSAFIAWNSMVTDIGNTHYRTMLFKNTLDINGFSDVTISVFGQYNLSINDAKYVQDLNGFISSPNNFSSLIIENSPILYGLADQITTNVGYHTNPSNDDQSYMFVNIDPTEALPSGVSKSLLSPLWIAFLNDIIRMRSCIRSSENAWKSFSPWISDPEDILTNSKYNSETYGDYYWKELIFHVCLHGASRINYFNIANSDKAMNDALNEWRNISLNSRARPCSNSSGDVSQEIDRIHIKDSTEVLLISGGRLLNSDKYIWRITAPPHKSIDGIVSFIRLGNDSDLPERIDVVDGFGAWVIRDVPNPPTYETYSNFLPEPTSSLDYALWANMFSGDDMFSGAAQYRWGNPNYPFLSIVPAIKISGGTNPSDVPYNGYRYPYDTDNTYIPQSQFNTLKEKIMSVPATRRVLNAYYWWVDIGVFTKLHYEYYKATADGTDYEGDRILTPWLNQNMEDGKLSVASFLTKCILDGIHFDYFMDDKEGQDVWFLNGRNTNNYWDGPNDPNPGLWYKSPMPDARTMSAVAADARFTTFVNPVSVMTFAEEFIYNYKNLTNQPNLTTPWQEILAPFIHVTDKADFITEQSFWTPYGCSPAPCGPEGFDRKEDGFDKFHYVIPAWNSVVSNLYFNYYINDMQHEVLQSFPEFQSTNVIHYSPYIVNAEESHFYQGSNLNRALQNPMKNGFISPIFYGIRFNIVYPSYAYPDTTDFTANFLQRSGYIKNTQNDNEKYNWNGNLVSAYMGPAGNYNIVRYPETNPVVNTSIDSALLETFYEELAFKFIVNDLKMLRSTLRSYSDYWETFAPWISDPLYWESVYNRNNKCTSYWYELIFHICLSGAQFINYFKEYYDIAGSKHVNDALNEWRNISFNSKARPCSNSEGNINTPVDRLILSNVFEDVLISGGLLLNSNKYLWRITVAPKHFSSNGTCVLQRQGDDSDIPEFITIVSGDIMKAKGAWIKRNISTPPIYKKYSSSGSDVTYNIYVNGSTGDDSGNGINPVKTIFKAVNLAKSYIDRGGNLNIEIRIHGGTYNMLGTDTKPILYLNSAYNPNGESTLTFKPATQSDEVIISGSDEITWDQFSLIPQDDPNRNLIPSNARENVYVASLSSYDIGPGYPTNWKADGIGSEVGKVYDLPTLPDLIFNDVLMTVARWPNKTTLTSSGIAMEESALIESVVDSGTNSTWTVDRQWLGWNDTTTLNPCEQSPGEDPSPCFRNGTFKYPEEYHSTIIKWTSNALAKGIFIKGWWRFDWHSETYKVTAINLSARTITVESKKSNYGIQDYRICNPDTGLLYSTSDNSFKSNTTKRRWFALNILEELDSPGEYYIDRATKKLYFWPPTQINPQSRISLTHRAVAGAGIKENNQLEVGFATNGSISRENYAYPGWSSEAIFGYSQFGSPEHSRMVYNTRYALKSLFKLNQVKNVIIEGLTFRNSAGSGIELRQCENVIVRNCKIYNINKHGIDAPGGKNVIIDTCTLHDIGLSAIINTGGNRQTLEPSNKLITKCSIKRWGKHESGLKLAAISIHGVGNTVSSNLISDGNTAIYFTYGSNITIEYNHFHNLAKHQDDTGAIYGGRNVSGFNVKIKNNFFNNVGTELDGGPRYEGAVFPGGQDVGCPGNIDNNKVVGSHAVYFDDFSCGNSVEGNVFYKCGTRDNTDAVFYNGGIKNEAKNNIFIDCNTAMSDVKTTIDNFNIVLADQVFSGLNTLNYPWYENGGPGNYTDLTTLNSATGYSPWTWYYSPAAYPQDRYKGLMQVVDIRTGTYKDAAPWLHSLYQFSNPIPGTNSTLTVNPAKVLENRNKQINNVFVNCEKRYKSYLVGDASFPGNTFITGEVEGNTNFFVNYANNNFRLTPSALQSIRNQQSSDFQEIPWDLIPTINR